MKDPLKSYLGHSYPAQLAELVKKTWPNEILAQLPNENHLRLLLDVAFHASFLRDEDRQVTFRLIFGDPEQFPAEEGPPTGLMPMPLEKPLLFDEQEIRRLSMAALYFRSLIGVRPNFSQELEIWGVVVSGTRWVSSLAGGRYNGAPMPNSITVHSLGPGRLSVYLGPTRLATLSGGRIESQQFDLSQSKWLRQIFADFRGTFLINAFGEDSAAQYVPVDQDFLRMISYNIVLRALSVVRNSRHGGTLVIIDPSEESLHAENAIRFQYRIANGPARRRYQYLLRKAVLRLAELAFERGLPAAGWNDYQSMRDPQLGDLDEALFDFAHFLADLMSVDGALILTHGLELVGFGAELRPHGPELPSVRHAKDLEGEIWAPASLDNVGTRHRAVYRFCDIAPSCLSIVISQDGSVQFVKKHNGAVTCWNTLSW